MSIDKYLGQLTKYVFWWESAVSSERLDRCNLKIKLRLQVEDEKTLGKIYSCMNEFNVSWDHTTHERFIGIAFSRPSEGGAWNYAKQIIESLEVYLDERTDNKEMETKVTKCSECSFQQWRHSLSVELPVCVKMNEVIYNSGIINANCPLVLASSTNAFSREKWLLKYGFRKSPSYQAELNFTVILKDHDWCDEWFIRTWMKDAGRFFYKGELTVTVYGYSKAKLTRRMEDIIQAMVAANVIIPVIGNREVYDDMKQTVLPLDYADEILLDRDYVTNMQSMKGEITFGVNLSKKYMNNETLLNEKIASFTATGCRFNVTHQHMTITAYFKYEDNEYKLDAISKLYSIIERLALDSVIEYSR